MKRILVVMLVVALLSIGLVGCAKEPAMEEEAVAAEPMEEEVAEPVEETYEIAMITDAGDIDDKSFNQGTWEGIVEYAEAKGVTYKYYKPTEVSTNAYVAAIDLAIQGGAKVVVTPGFLFETAIYVAQDKYPDTHFILLDGAPHNEDYTDYVTGSNVYAYNFAEQQVGFLAGYAAVKEGYTKIGFMGGMAVPAVVRYGYGFVQGAEYAAKELGLDSVDLKYHYTGDFEATPKNQTTAATWYNDGTEVIFAAGGKVGNSVMTAAESADAYVIGVDVDQSVESDSVIFSAMKALALSVQAGLDGYYDGTFKGGVYEILDITADGVSLSMDTAKLENFTQADYEALVEKLKTDTSLVVLGDTDAESAADLPTEIVKVTIVE